MALVWQATFYCHVTQLDLDTHLRFEVLCISFKGQLFNFTFYMKKYTQKTTVKSTSTNLCSTFKTGRVSGPREVYIEFEKLKKWSMGASGLMTFHDNFVFDYSAFFIT